MHDQIPSRDSASFQLMARLAGVLSRPSQMVHPAHFAMLGGELVRKLAEHPNFQPQIDDAVGKSLNLHTLDLAEDLPERLKERAETRAAVLLASAQQSELQEAARFLAAAILHKRLVRLIRREDRAGAMEQLGGAAFQLAVREAFALYAELAELAPPEQADAGKDGIPEKPELPILLRPGYDCLLAFIRKTESTLQPLVTYRLPDGYVPAFEADAINVRRQTQILSLFRRKMPGWARWIA